jgi:hypothetical protein
VAEVLHLLRLLLLHPRRRRNLRLKRSTLLMVVWICLAAAEVVGAETIRLQANNKFLRILFFFSRVDFYVLE